MFHDNLVISQLLASTVVHDCASTGATSWLSLLFQLLIWALFHDVHCCSIRLLLSPPPTEKSASGCDFFSGCSTTTSHAIVSSHLVTSFAGAASSSTTASSTGATSPVAYAKGVISWVNNITDKLNTQTTFFIFFILKSKKE